MSTETKEEKPESNNKSVFTRRIIDIKELGKVLKKGANHGLCGGHNLGNTCFMNSSIACLSNCTELTTYFLTGKYKSDINTKNKEGVGGRLAEAWHDLLEEYWNSGARAGNPGNVKSMVAKKAAKFYGFSQQDSNEFMTEFLSILSEDLNKTDKKVYKELKEKSKDEDDLKCAERFWNLHLHLNNSIITDLFSGLFKTVVKCPNCNFENITFDPFNTLTLAIPSLDDIYEIIKLYYTPKYSIRKNCCLNVIVKKNSSLKEIIEETKNIEEFKFDLKKLKVIKVLDNKLLEYVGENDTIQENDHIFAFDDLTKEGEKNNIIPLYLYNNSKISAFPRLLFLEENINFGQLKRKIYYFARNCLSEPFKGKNEVDNEIKKYKEENEYDEQKLWSLFDKEYEEIFGNQTNKEDFDKFLNDFPYKIVIKTKFNQDGGSCIFNGKNILDNLKEFEISKDEDPITNLLNKILNKECYINLIINTKSSYAKEKLNFNTCENFKSKNKEINLNLDGLISYFCSTERLDKGNRWRCGNCKEKVEATKKYSIFYVPRLLIICLNRFSKSGYYYSKNGQLIDFPIENLDMGKYICGPDQDHSKYDLFAVSQHYGSTGGGHYTAICKNVDGFWYDYNDSSCSRTSTSNIVTSAAYVLFYRRRTW